VLAQDKLYLLGGFGREGGHASGARTDLFVLDPGKPLVISWWGRVLFRHGSRIHCSVPPCHSDALVESPNLRRTCAGRALLALVLRGAWAPRVRAFRAFGFGLGRSIDSPFAFGASGRSARSSWCSAASPPPG